MVLIITEDSNINRMEHLKHLFLISHCILGSYMNRRMGPVKITGGFTSGHATFKLACENGEIYGASNICKNMDHHNLLITLSQLILLSAMLHMALWRYQKFRLGILKMLMLWIIQCMQFVYTMDIYTEQKVRGIMIEFSWCSGV